MSATDTWIHNVEADLAELLASPGDLDAEDAWRLLVLLGRAAQHPSPPQEIEELVDRSTRSGATRRALTLAARPDGAALLDALDAALLAGEDPAGSLADALLDLDDFLAVLDLEGRRQEAGALAAQAVALIDLAPHPAAVIDTWGQRRLATMEPDATAAPIWGAVSAAAATAAVYALPVARGKRALDVDRLLDLAGGTTLVEVIDLFSAAPSVKRAWAAAASDFGSPWQPAEGDSWTTYAEGEDTVAQVHVGLGLAPPTVARLVVEAQEQRWTHTVHAVRRSGRSAWFRLGSEQDLARLFERAREKLEVSTETPVRIRLEWGGDAHR